jgi:hypothetical protein
VKKIVALGLTVSGIAWAVARRGSEPEDVWAQVTDRL